LLSKNFKIKIYRNIILPVVLYGCETWSLREESRLSVFENRVLRRTFWPKRDEVICEWRKLHNEDLNDLYSSRNNVIEKNEMAGHVARLGERRRTQRFWWGNIREREHVEDLGVDGRILLRWIFWK
jgi:hypothetical protein